MAARPRSNVVVAGVALSLVTALCLAPRAQRRAAASAVVEESPPLPQAPAEELLAETIGLELHLALLADDRCRFTELVAVVRDVLLAPCGLLSWRVEAGIPATSSASVDDLKAVRALLAGAERWGRPDWAMLAHGIADAALGLETVDGMLVEGASWESGDVVASRAVETAYLDLETIASLAEREPRWAIVYANAQRLLERAQTPRGLFPRRVDLAGRALAGGEVNAIHVLYCGIHLAEVGQGGDRTLAFFVEQLERDGKLEGRFELAGGEPIPGYEDVAVYSLAARLALLLDQHETARRFLDRMQEIRPARADHVPFDDLQASIALLEERLAREIDPGQED